MGFPLGYADLSLPTLIIHILTLLNFIRRLISTILHFIGIEYLNDIESPPDPTQPDPLTDNMQSFSAVLLRELLPVLKFSELVDPPESCVVCLYDFEAGDEIRGLTNCSHVFHRCCIDRWMDHDRKTCPLCRTPFIPEDLQHSINERLWADSGIAEYYDDSTLFATS
ncbi:brassinosteroid-responsive RING protein 1-like [Rutidosis leptorrhynchoides]|uniref:brassinosteroid-responsive RING protein 1-like n=1 Tax=Rutidosis leptorrhynchoides TaxID=125765 RepID=UPI003A9A2BD2